ncbi:classical arabinogalactan protein 9-like [Panicum virgatum]|uniref:classical arabinogalactan protein 9-like n=1 Tax=Panicum virgatum TaxID=38727 RepID=UPI0019D53902|nr:classical arabinogalactan protein 9-like [Panicum virgatum]
MAVLVLDDDDDLLDDMARPPDLEPPPAACGSSEHLFFHSPPPPSTRPPAATPAPAATTSSTAPVPGAFSPHHTLDDSPTLTATPASATSSSSPTGTPLPSPGHESLSPDAAPLFPSGHSNGRGKQLRWRDDTPPLSDDDSSPYYRDILLRQSRAASLTPAAVQVDAPAPMPTLRSVVVLPPHGEGGHRKRPRRWDLRLPSPPPWTDKRSQRSIRRHGTTELDVGLQQHDHPHKAGQATPSRV